MVVHCHICIDLIQEVRVKLELKLIILFLLLRLLSVAVMGCWGLARVNNVA